MRILFVCIHNSARSQLAEEITRRLCPEIEAESAGIEPGTLNPLVVEVLFEDGIDIRGKETRDVFEVYKQGRLYSHVITVCDEASAERCPIFPGVTRRVHWSFTDPSTFEGSWEERLEQTRRVRDEIKEKVLQFFEVNCEIAV
ncbi:MAG TPA: arsenate reductase ArsC [Candidatus Kapabacteria bacterium]|nr:arsenate reductase ArsC [Candidatus Kapabacteria bacterium]